METGLGWMKDTMSLYRSGKGPTYDQVRVIPSACLLRMFLNSTVCHII